MSERVAIYLDAENLFHGAADRTALERVVGVVREAVGDATVVLRVSACDRTTARRLVPVFRDLGFQVFVHAGGADAADRALIDRIVAGLPPSVTTVVIASGDHAFAPVAARLRAAGRRVTVIARAGSIAASLYRAADRCVLVDAA